MSGKVIHGARVVRKANGDYQVSLGRGRVLDIGDEGETAPTLLLDDDGSDFATAELLEARWPAASHPRATSYVNGSPWDVISGVWTERGVGGVTIVPITADTELSIAAHSGKILRMDAARTLTAPEGLGTYFSCIIEWPAGTTATFDPTGATQIQDTATPAGSTATRTRTHSNNPSGVVLKSTGTANVLSLSGS